MALRLGVTKRYLRDIEGFRRPVTLQDLELYSKEVSISLSCIVHLSVYLHDQYIKKSNSHLINSGFCDKSIAVIRWLERGRKHRVRNKHHLRELQF